MREALRVWVDFRVAWRTPLWQSFYMMLGYLRLSPILLVCLCFWGTGSQAETIRKACLVSDRGSAQPRLCTCLQGAADRTLSAKDQKTAAGFFRNPDEAQRMRRSDRRRDEAFWERYERFGETARKHCRKK